jgi:2-polyprenyl-3-methyl-5-hydroxy-6-metoxy-1,4-benzoquinol methylase
MTNNRIDDLTISEEQINKIRAIEYFSKSQYVNVDLVKTIKSYYKRYVKPLEEFKKLNSEMTLIDIGTGYGWLALAFAFSTDANIIAVEYDEPRLNAAKEISKILEIEHRITWKVGSIENLPVDSKAGDVVYCIEVIEHINKSKLGIEELKRVSKDLLIITTPNLWFPIISHDTMLPFCHWLPIPVRRIYAKLFNRLEREDGNLFWSPASLKKSMTGFIPVSKWLHYFSFKSHLSTFPYYDIYRLKDIEQFTKSRYLYYNFISRFGMHSHYFVPSLAYVFKRTEYK